MNKRITAAILSVLLTASVLFSCEGQTEEIKTKHHTFFEPYFDTFSTVYDYTGSSDADFDALCEEIEGELSRYHRLFDIYNEYEGIINLATLNKTAGEGAKRVDPEICELLSFAKEMYSKTDGAVNIAFGSVLSLWHDAREAACDEKNPEYYIPKIEELLSADEHTSIENIVIDTAASTVEILDSETRIDVGAVAKGYVAEKISDFIKSKGLLGYAVDFGGNLRVIGTKPSGVGVVSGIFHMGGYSINPVELKDSALVTSGIYERSYTVEGVDYHHIINPDTLMPENNYWSVSVKNESSAVADALSTAFFNMSEEKIEATLKRIPDTEVTVIYPSGEVKIIK